MQLRRDAVARPVNEIRAVASIDDDRASSIVEVGTGDWLAFRKCDDNTLERRLPRIADDGEYILVFLRYRLANEAHPRDVAEDILGSSLTRPQVDEDEIPLPDRLTLIR